ncbi:cytochrome c oxidase subunit 7A2, mitochondrial-like [Dendrobates tinctorius]|uniref:cytochrome c oxidase subunit 7A2, mitochondrial-like n=1 Tax=Dendrobates tinctorius TaxID=92724 RepID=UPI003CC9AECB
MQTFFGCPATSISGREDHLCASLSDDPERTSEAQIRATISTMRNYLVLGQRISRAFTTSSRSQMQNRVPEKQKIFQADNDLPVHLKGGSGDLILYRITMGITIAGSLLAFGNIVMASLPQKK